MVSVTYDLRQKGTYLPANTQSSQEENVSSLHKNNTTIHSENYHDLDIKTKVIYKVIQ